MSDTFYLRQQNGGNTGKKVAQPRKLKKDHINEIKDLLGQNIEGLDKCTIATLMELETAIIVKLNSPEE